VAGLAIAQSIVAGVEVAILVVIIIKRDRKLFDLNFLGALVRIASVTGFSIAAGFLMVSLFPLELINRGIFGLGSRVAIIAFVVFTVHFTVSYLFDLEEVKPVFKRVKRFLARTASFQF
jgi:hypothetical protein